jgi:hypothetical protein
LFALIGYVTLGTNDLQRAVKFYDAIHPVLHALAREFPRLTTTFAVLNALLDGKQWIKPTRRCLLRVVGSDTPGNPC